MWTGAVTFFCCFTAWALFDLHTSAATWRGGSRAAAVVSLGLHVGAKLLWMCRWLKPHMMPPATALRAAAAAGGHTAEEVESDGWVPHARKNIESDMLSSWRGNRV